MADKKVITRGVERYSTDNPSTSFSAGAKETTIKENHSAVNEVSNIKPSKANKRRQRGRNKTKDKNVPPQQCNVSKKDGNLNVYQQNVLDKINKNRVTTNYQKSPITDTTLVDQNKKTNLNVHQLRIMEKMSKKEEINKHKHKKKRSSSTSPQVNSKNSSVQKNIHPTVEVKNNLTIPKIMTQQKPVRVQATNVPKYNKPTNVQTANVVPNENNPVKVQDTSIVPNINKPDHADIDSNSTPRNHKKRNRNNSAEKRLQHLRSKLSKTVEERDFLKTKESVSDAVSSPFPQLSSHDSFKTPNITKSENAEKRLQYFRSKLSKTFDERDFLKTKESVSNAVSSPLPHQDSLKTPSSTNREGFSDAENYKFSRKRKFHNNVFDSPQGSESFEQVPKAHTSGYNISRTDVTTPTKYFKTDLKFNKRSKVEPSMQLSNVVLYENSSSVSKLDVKASRGSEDGSRFFASKLTDNCDISGDQEMDWESIVEQIIQVREDSQHSNANRNIKLFNDKSIEKNVKSTSITTFIVIDTNVFISHLNTVEKLTDPSCRDENNCDIRVMVPWIVLCELDKLKLYSNGNFAQTNMMARKAMRYLHENLSTNPYICGQSMKLANDHLFPCPLPDDEILNCCLQLSGKGENAILLTNDINLCNKAAVNGIKMFTHNQFIEEFFTSSKMNSSLLRLGKTESKCPSSEAESSMPHNSDIQLDIVKENTQTVSEKFKCLESVLCRFLSFPLEAEMKDKFDNLWTKIILVEPPWTLSDTLKCLSKHWIAVFKDVLPRKTQDAIKSLQRFFPPGKRASINTLTNANFEVAVTLAVNLVECFEFNLKYSKSAEQCIHDIHQLVQGSKSTSDPPKPDMGTLTDTCNNNLDQEMIIGLEDNVSCVLNEEIVSSKNIMEVFKLIFDELNKFCASLANALDVSHNIITEGDATPVPLQNLVSPATAIGRQLQLIVNSTSRLVSSFMFGNLSSIQREQEKILASEALANILKDTLSGLGHTNINFGSSEVLMFCSMHRNLIEEAYNNFIILQNLIMECSQKYAALQAL